MHFHPILKRRTLLSLAVNDAPTITDGPGTSSLAETDAALAGSGTFTVSDVDTTDTVTAAVNSVAVTGTASSNLPSRLDNAALQAFLSVSPTEVLDDTQTTNTLTWNFNSGTEAFNFLAQGETLILTYTVSATDDGGAPMNDTETVTVTITGTNDAPAITQLSSADDDAVAAYDFENGTDSIAPGGPAITVNAPVTISDTAGFTTGSNGLLFPTGDVDSSTNPVSIGAIPGIETFNEFSFTAQVRFDAGDGDRNFERIFDFGAGQNDSNLILTRNLDTNDLLLAIRRGPNITGNLVIAGALDGIEGEFHQYGVTLDDTGLAKVFIDGTEVGSMDVGVNGIPNYAEWDENYIGSSNFSGNKRFQGAIDDIGIFDRALTASEMASLANTSTPQAFAVDEAAPNTTSVGFVHGGDVDGDTVTYSITSQEHAGAFAIDAITGEITVADSSALDFESDTAHDVVVNVSDGSDSSDETVTIQINDTVEAAQTVPGAQSVAEDGELIFNAVNGNAVTVSDSFADSEVPLQVSLSVDDGILNLSGLTGITIVEGADGSGSITFNGTESDINAALEGLKFTPDADFNGSVTLNMETAIAVDLEGFYTFEGGNADDQSAGTANDGALEDGALIVNDPTRGGDVLSLDGTDAAVTIAGRFGEPQDVTLAIFVDLNTYDTSGSTFISLGDSVILWASEDNILRGTFSSDGGFSATLADVDLTSLGWTHIAYTIDSTTNVQRLYLNGELVSESNSTDAIVYENGARSQLGGRIGNNRSDVDGLLDDARIYTRALSADEIASIASETDRDSDSVAIAVNPVNDAPDVSAPGSAYSFIEQGSLAIHGTGFSVSDVDEEGGDLTAVFTVGEGRVLIDPDASGVTVLTGNSTDTVTFSGTAAEINALLDGTSGTITFLHDQTVASDTPSASTTITLTVNDQGNTGSDPGDSGDGSSEESFASQTINITSVNDAPTFLGPELVSNGDFGNSDLAGTGWTTTGAAAVQSGQLNFGASNATTENTLSQTINTVDGETYTLSFNYRDRSGGTNTRNQSLFVSVDGDENLLTTEAILTDTDDENYVRYSFTFIADSATSTIKFTDTSANAGSMSSGTDSSDGRLDNISVKQTDGNLSAVTFVEDSTAVVLDSDLTLSDAEISEGLDNYDGTTLVLNRNGGADSEDVFSATGNLVFSGGTLTLSGTDIGFVNKNSDGELQLAFSGAHVTEAMVNETLQSIAYENTSDTPPSSVQINWTFNDSNEAAESDPQGTGGSLTATGSTTVNITAVNDAPVLTQNDFSISEGGVLTLTTSNINATDVDGDSLTFTVTNVTGGGFYVGADGSYNSDQSFTMAQLLAGDVVFLHGGTDDAPAFEVSVSDGTDSTSAVSANITFTEVNDRPYIDAGGLSDVSIINTTVSGDQVQPESITLGDGSLVVAYSDGTNTYAQRFDSSGNAFGIEIQLDDTASSSEVDIVATSDGGFIATWTDSINLYARRFDSSGVAVNGSTEIDFAIDTDRTRPEITELSDGKILLSYFAGFGVDSSDQTVAATLLDANFNDSAITAEISNEIIVPDVQAGTQFDPKITALAGGGFAIAFSDGVGRDGDGHGVFVQFYDTSGNLVGANQQVNANTDGNQQVFDVEQLTNGDVLVAYRDINAGGGFNTFAQRYSDTGVAQGSPFVLNQTTSGFQNAIDLVPLSDGKFAASWITFLDNGERQVFVRQFDASGNPLTDELFVAAGDIIASPTIAAFGDDSVRISWTGDADSGNGEDIFSRSISFAPHSVSFTENATGVVLHDSINLIDFDDSDLTGATLQITGNFATAEDALNFSNQNNITGIYDSVNGTLTLTGTDSIANYEAALRSITYVNGSDNPDPSTRSIEWTVTDGTDDSYTTTTEVDVVAVNDAPIVNSPASPFSFTEQGSLAIQGTGFLVSDVDDNGGQLTAIFTVGEGRVLIDPAGSGVTVSTGNSTDTVTFSGTKDQINSLLDGSFGTITYLHDQTVGQRHTVGVHHDHVDRQRSRQHGI